MRGRGQPTTVRQHVLLNLRTRILQGRYAAGSRLRQEEIARQLDVSTTPVREAFRDLLSEGLISLDERRGAVVRGLTLDDVQEIYQMRIRLEPLLAARTFDGIKDDDLARAEACHRKMCGKVSAQSWAGLNEEFHAALTGNSNSGRLGSVVYNLAHAASPYVVLSMFAEPDIRDMNNRDHAELLTLYRNRDRDGVVDKTERHLAQTLRLIEQEAQLKSALVHHDDSELLHTAP
ncbi:GntR family transcriptional regulator [Rhodopseudomonas sp. NSM]|uniref:GntR family transcriptional regulator n=1 Tax=Rhodopseudomonas sp. NSM TaxID=3457630 RepID=UPI004034FC65